MPCSGQAPPLTDEEIESRLKENHYARICTHNKDRTIHAMHVGYGYINSQILMMSLVNSRKNKNIERKNGVTVLVDTLNPVTRSVLIYGNPKTHHIIFNNTATEKPRESTQYKANKKPRKLDFSANR